MNGVSIMKSGNQPKRANFRSFGESTQADWELIHSQYMDHASRLPDRIMAHLRLLEGDFGGFPVDRLTHCLQTATRAHQAGEDEEDVVCALLHDSGEPPGSSNHADGAA